MSFIYKSLENHLSELRKMYAETVDNIIRDATEKSEDGYFEINFNDVPDDLDMPENRYLITEMLYERDEVIEAEAHGYGLMITLNPQYCQRMFVDPDAMPESHLQSPFTTDLIATYENLRHVPKNERLTRYWGDYGGYVTKHGVTDEHLRSVYAEALQIMGMSSDAYHDKKFIYRGEVETYMRSCMLGRILCPDDEIVFVPPSPTGPDGQWQYEAGRVIEVNAVAKNCVVSFEDGEATIPFRYVMARFYDNAPDNAFGFEHAEAIFDLPESWGEHFLWEARREYEEQHLDENETLGEDECSGMVMQ